MSHPVIHDANIVVPSRFGYDQTPALNISIEHLEKGEDDHYVSDREDIPAERHWTKTDPLDTDRSCTAVLCRKLY